MENLHIFVRQKWIYQHPTEAKVLRQRIFVQCKNGIPRCSGLFSGSSIGPMDQMFRNVSIAARGGNSPEIEDAKDFESRQGSGPAASDPPSR